AGVGHELLRVAVGAIVVVAGAFEYRGPVQPVANARRAEPQGGLQHAHGPNLAPEHDEGAAQKAAPSSVPWGEPFSAVAGYLRASRRRRGCAASRRAPPRQSAKPESPISAMVREPVLASDRPAAAPPRALARGPPVPYFGPAPAFEPPPEPFVLWLQTAPFPVPPLPPFPPN